MDVHSWFLYGAFSLGGGESCSQLRVHFRRIWSCFWWGRDHFSPLLWLVYFGHKMWPWFLHNLISWSRHRHKEIRSHRFSATKKRPRQTTRRIMTTTTTIIPPVYGHVQMASALRRRWRRYLLSSLYLPLPLLRSCGYGNTARCCRGRCPSPRSNDWGFPAFGLIFSTAPSFLSSFLGKWYWRTLHCSTRCIVYVFGIFGRLCWWMVVSDFSKTEVTFVCGRCCVLWRFCLEMVVVRGRGGLWIN